MKKLILCIGLLLGSCHEPQRPPQPTARQSDQLNEAEDMLNEMAQNEEGPEANASGPSNSTTD